jgi:hypothetical protein
VIKLEFYNTITEEYISALKDNIVEYCFKVQLMDYRENVLLDISQDISKEDTGSISINYQQGLRRSCAVSIINVFNKYHFAPEGQGVEDTINSLSSQPIWIQNKFKIFIGIKAPKLRDMSFDSNKLEYNNNSNNLYYTSPTLSNDFEIDFRKPYKKKMQYYDTYWFSQGVYVLTNPTILRENSKSIITLNGVDKFGVFGSETKYKEMEGTYFIPMGTKIKNIIKDILNLDMGNGCPIDVKEPIIDNSIAEMTLPYDIKKSPETYFSDMLIELANVFACDIFYDTDGVLNFIKGNENQDKLQDPSLWDYSDNENLYFTPSLNMDFNNVYNVIKVIGNNPATDVYTTILKNEDLSSPTCVQHIGEKIKYIESTFCYNESRTKDFAKYLLKKYSIMQSSISFQSTILPHLEVNKIITISDKVFKYDNQRFVIQSLTLPFSSKTLMDIEATNTANIPYFEY